MKDTVKLHSTLVDMLLHKAGKPTNEFTDEQAFSNFKSRFQFEIDGITQSSQSILELVLGHSSDTIHQYEDLFLKDKMMEIYYSDIESRNTTVREGLTQVTSAALNL